MIQTPERMAVDFQDASSSLEAICREFEFLADLEQLDISIEALSISMEDTVYGGRPNAATMVAQGLANKTWNGIKKVGETAVKTAKGEYNIIEKAKAFTTKLAKFINTVSMALNKVFVTGYPLMGTIRKKVKNLKDMAKADAFKQVEGSIEVGKAHEFFTVGDKILNPDEIIRSLQFLIKVTNDILSKGKLSKFQQLSQATLEPFRDSIKSTRVDTVVFLLAVMATVTNPGTAIGVVLKRIFQAANPGLGGKIEKVATVAGGVYGGVGSLALAMAGGGASALKEMSNGRLNISDIPKFSPIYPFCVKEVKTDKELTITKRSETLLGNRYWEVSDFTDQLQENMKGSMSTLGANFKCTEDKVEKREIQPLSKEQVVVISDLIDQLMAVAQDYCKQWPNYAKTYNQEYSRISDIVMTHSDSTEDDKKSATAHYVRYSYRNAMSLMLAGMWKNCFGADNQFVRYLVSLCRHLITYCNKSINQA